MNWHKIPNSLVLAIVAAFYTFAVVKGLPSGVITNHTLVALAALIVLTLAAGLAGGGAIKLTAAIVLWLGFEHGCIFVAITFLSLAAVAILMRFSGARAETLPVMPFTIAAVAIMSITGVLPEILAA